MSPSGKLIVDEGAIKALKSGKSLLPAGVVKIEGKFQRGDTVKVISMEGMEIGRGLVAYNFHDATKIAGHRSSDIEQILGYSERDELIHRSDMVIN